MSNTNQSLCIKTTYTQTTPESASEGDFSETGWEDESGEVFESVEEAILWLKRAGACEVSSTCFHEGVWYSTDSYTIDHHTGTDEQESFHLYGFSLEQEEQVYNALFGKGDKS